MNEVQAGPAGDMNGFNGRRGGGAAGPKICFDYFSTQPLPQGNGMILTLHAHLKIKDIVVEATSANIVTAKTRY